MRCLRVTSWIALLCMSSSACSSWLPDGTLRLTHRCQAADTITVTVDSRVVGTVAPSSTGDFPLRPGGHTVVAKSANGYEWPAKSVQVVAGQVVSLSADCP